MRFRVSVDTGGTFTDVVACGDDGELRISKALTTYDRAFDGIAAALSDIADRLGLGLNALLAATDVFTYGTTRSTNAIVEDKTARTAFLTTEGFPDILLLREGGKLGPFRHMPFTPPYVPRHLTWEIPERIDSDGAVFVELDERGCIEAIEAAVEQRCEAIGVCLLWSTVNPRHELRLGELIQFHAPGVPFTLSHQLNPVPREYRRASATVIDASLKPMMQAFFDELERDLRDAGLAGELLISTSFGGAWRPTEIVERPIYSVGSGPSMAPVAALTFARQELTERSDAVDLLVCDTGGTTFDVGVIISGELRYTSETWLGERYTGHLTGIRAVDVKSIGAGGGSIAWIDDGGLIHVGPQSAGADPGPACYDRGGDAPTVTDAAVLLGYLDASNFLGGRLQLNHDAAERSFRTLAGQLEMSVEEAADAALTIASNNIVGAIQEITISQGIDPRDVTIVAGGGASGLNIVKIARELNVGQVLLPGAAGAFSACGALHADAVAEFTESRYAETRDLDVTVVNEALARAEQRADGFLASLGGIAVAATRKEFFVEARYRQQSWDLTVRMPSERLHTRDDVLALEEAFHVAHERVFAIREPGAHLECLSWKVRAVAELVKPALAARAAGAETTTEPALSASAYFDGIGIVDTPRYDGDTLTPDTTISGPAVIREPTTTIVVYPGATARMTAGGNYLIDTGTQPAEPVPAAAEVHA